MKFAQKVGILNAKKARNVGNFRSKNYNEDFFNWIALNSKKKQVKSFKTGQF
jgi:hypothetical protein